MKNGIAKVARQIANNLNELGDKVAIVIDGEDFSYSFLRGRVATTSKTILSETEPDEIIGVQLENNINCYIGLIAILVSGRCFVPVNVGFGLDQSIYMMKTAKVRFVIQTEESPFIERLCELVPLKMLRIAEPTEGQVVHHNSKNAYLLFTSGSMGDPKGVLISHLNLDNFILGIVDDTDWSLNSEDRFLQCFNLSFDFFVFTVHLPLYLGATFLTVPLDRISIYSTAMLVEHGISVSAMVPSTMKIINKISKSMIFESVRLSFFCGEALYASDLKNWMERTPYAKQINLYGPTEATVAVSKFVWKEGSDKEVVNDIVPIGSPFGNNSFELLELEGGEKELLLGGPQVFNGYIGKDKDPFVTHNGQKFYRSGDICKKNDNGNFLFVGRNDGQVKVDGIRIELSDVENKLKNLFPNHEIIVIHQTNTEKTELPSCFLYWSKNRKRQCSYK